MYARGRMEIDRRRKWVRESIYRSWIRLIKPRQIITTLFLNGVIAWHFMTQTCKVEGRETGKTPIVSSGVGMRNIHLSWLLLMCAIIMFLINNF